MGDTWTAVIPALYLHVQSGRARRKVELKIMFEGD